MPIYFIATSLLVATIMLPGKVEVKLLLIIVHSALSHSLIPFLYPLGAGIPYGTDERIDLGKTRLLYEDTVDVRGNTWYNPFPYQISPLLQIYLSTRVVMHYSLATVLGRMFLVDIFWSHSLFVPILWNICIPLGSYAITKVLTKEDKVAALSAFLASLVPSLVYMGARSIPNSLGLVFFFFTLIAAVRYISFGKKKDALLLVVGASTSFLSHFLTGALSFVLLMLTITYKQVQKNQINMKIKDALLSLTVITCITLLPLTLYIQGFIHPTIKKSFFTLNNLSALPIYDAVSKILFGKYAEFSLSTAIVLGLVPFLGLLGIVYGYMSKKNKKSLYSFLLLLYTVIWVDYIILECFMSGVPLSPERLWIFQGLVALGPMAVLINATLSFIRERYVYKFNPKSENFWSHHKISATYLISAGLVVLSLSSLATSSLYHAYPQREPTVTTYDLEAIRFIDKTTFVNYVVVCDRPFAEVGATVTGYFTHRGAYTAYWDTTMRRLYDQMIGSPSLAPMLEAAGYTDSDIVYFAVNELRTENFAYIVQMASVWTETYASFGDGSLYVFRWYKPEVNPIEGVGPSVYVHNLGKNVSTTYVLNLISLDTWYTITLTGNTEYQITAIPLEWSFESVSPEPDSLQIQLDTEHRWVNFTGSADTSYTVTFYTWLLYQSCWVDDSFAGTISRSKMVEFSTDGDVAVNTFRKPDSETKALAWSQIKGVTVEEGYNYFLLRHRINDISISELRVVFWKSDGSTIEKRLTKSAAWTTDAVYLTDDEVRGIAMIGLSAWTTSSDTYQWYWDYVMFSKLSPEVLEEYTKK